LAGQRRTLTLQSCKVSDFPGEERMPAGSISAGIFFIKILPLAGAEG